MNQKNSEQTELPPKKQSIEGLAFYASPSHDCGYLPDRSSVTLFADPEADMDMDLYGVLLEYGFRRSGAHVYRPHCPTCRACMAARIPVEQFQPNRSQKRCLRRNQSPDSEIQAHATEPAFREEHFVLYRKYMAARHTGGGMDDPSENKYMEFLTSSWANTEFVEFRFKKQLVAVAIKNCQKMLYKQEYRPIELYQENRWHSFDRQQELATTTL
jgi:arginine-tRNA-protein transferase